jgi:alkylhydroperoxidase family enzyme
MTLLPSHQDSQAQYQALQDHFTDSEVVNLTLAIATINAWNRFGVGFAMVPA